jgi:hypothetical protein
VKWPSHLLKGLDFNQSVLAAGSPLISPADEACGIPTVQMQIQGLKDVHDMRWLLILGSSNSINQLLDETQHVLPWLVLATI